MSRKYSFAVLLCRFSDDMRGFVSINRQSVVDMFTAPGVENVVQFWHDMSFGKIDLSGSTAYPAPDAANLGWITLPQKQSDYNGSGANPPGRQALVDWAKSAARAANVPVDSFDGVVVYMSTNTDLWGGGNEVVCHVDSNLSQILQEVGHALGLLTHSRAVSSGPGVDYMDPFCIMSSMTFGDVPSENVTFQGAFGTSGPGLCGPYIAKMGWLDRIATVATPNGRTPRPTVVNLSALGDQNPAHDHAAVFDLPPAKYFVEYRAGGWDRGLLQSAVVVHQYRTDQYAYYAGNIPTSKVLRTVGKEILSGGTYVDSQADLSVRVLSILDDGATAMIQIAAAAAVQTLSVVGIAQSVLQIRVPFSVRQQLCSSGSVRNCLLELLAQ
jgi:hypothetical protein